MKFHIGEPQFLAYCTECGRNVGGPYFDVCEATARKREHFRNVHVGATYFTYGKRITTPPLRVRAAYQ